MQVISTKRNILYEGRFRTIRRCVEHAVRNDTDLSCADLKTCNLQGAKLDNARMDNACLWGASLEGATMTWGSFRDADFRGAGLSGADLSGADLSGSDLSGASMSRTVIAGANLNDAIFSCPTVLTLNFAEADSLEGAVYLHRGLRAYPLSAMLLRTQNRKTQP